MKRHLRWMVAVLLGFGIQGWVAGAGPQDEAKERMRQRAPAIQALKKVGVVGENNKGYLTVLKKEGAADAAGLVEAENADRRIAYAYLAGTLKTLADKVGERRALQIAEKAGQGEWIQDAQGKWTAK